MKNSGYFVANVLQSWLSANIDESVRFSSLTKAKLSSAGHRQGRRNRGFNRPHTFQILKGIKAKLSLSKDPELIITVHRLSWLFGIVNNHFVTWTSIISDLPAALIGVNQRIGNPWWCTGAAVRKPWPIFTLHHHVQDGEWCVESFGHYLHHRFAQCYFLWISLF